MNRSLRFVSSLCVLAALVVAPTARGQKQEDTSVAAFLVLKRDVEELRQDAERKKFRHNYDKLVARLQALAQAHKDGTRADDAVFVAAQLLEELYYVSRMASDKEAAIDAFVACADRYPKSNLADDALVAAARLTDDPIRGRKCVDRVLQMGTSADLRAEATALKKSRFSDEAVSAEKAARAPSAQVVAALALVKEVAPGAKVATATQVSPAEKPASKAASNATQFETHAHEHHEDDQAGVTVSVHGPAMTPAHVLPERPPAGTPTRKVTVIRHDKTAQESRIQLRMSGDVGVTRGEVPPAPGQGRRIFFDLAPAKLGHRNIQPIEVNDGVVARVRAGQYDMEVVRVVVELVGDAEPTLHVTRKPFEITLSSPIAPPASLSAAAQGLVASSTGTQTAPAVAPRSSPPKPDAQEVKARFGSGTPGGVSISQQLGLRVHRVVLDPGHGGNDTGAIGIGGVKEKDITLQIALRIREKLRAEMPDVEVIMTREDDRTLALQDRTNIANASGADLFISVHCNASPMRRVRGVETYTLNVTHDRYAMRLAARENVGVGDGSISDLDFILADLAMKSNVDDSVRLGRQVQQSVVKDLHQRWSDVPDLGLKHALFYVLMGNRMPSILLETSFLSNKVEEQRLASVAYQESIADGVVFGVQKFVEERQAFYMGK